MTGKELEIIQNLVLDGTEAYVNAKFNTLTFVKTDIGVVSGNGTNQGNKVNVKGAVYDDIKSVGNIIFTSGCVVFLLIPNSQYNNMFILGQLDDTPANIKGGTIDIGNGTFTVDNYGNMTCNSGAIAGMYIDQYGISSNSPTNSGSSGIWILPTRNKGYFACGEAGYTVCEVGAGTRNSQYGIHCSNDGASSAWNSGVWIDKTGVYKDGTSYTTLIDNAKQDVFNVMNDQIRGEGKKFFEADSGAILTKA